MKFPSTVCPEFIGLLFRMFLLYIKVFLIGKAIYFTTSK